MIPSQGSMNRRPLAQVYAGCDYVFMMIVEEILLAARPALEAILTPEELERTHLDLVTAKGEPVTSSTIVSTDLLLRVFVFDEEMGFWLYPP